MLIINSRKFGGNNNGNVNEYIVNCICTMLYNYNCYGSFTKSEQGGASESIMGSSGSNFYEKIKEELERKIKNSTIFFSLLYL